MPEFESFFSCENLSKCYQSLLDGHFDVIAECPRIQTGADRIELAYFERDQVKHIAAISRKVQTDRYTFSPFLERQIPKPDSKDLRTISIACIRDSIVQRAIYEYLYPIVDSKLTSSVFGFRKGISAHDAVRLVRSHFTNGMTCVFDADIEKFFDSVKRDILLEMIGGLVLDERAVTLIRRFLKTGRIPFAQVLERQQRTGKQTKYTPEPGTMGVPQGGVLSGLLSNLYLSNFDVVMGQQFVGYVRYADDFLVCCKSEEHCKQAHALTQSRLDLLRVRLNPDKTKECVPATPGVDFLGFRICARGVRIRGRNILKFKMRIRSVLETQRLGKSPAVTLRSLVRRLEYKIRGPSEEQLKKLAARGKKIGRCRRSWIGYFRIVDDTTQVRSVDHWIRRQVSAFMWEKHRLRVRLKQLQEAGLPSLMKCLWHAREKQCLET
jgi:group II intron reverse transcriptase/maturase